MKIKCIVCQSRNEKNFFTVGSFEIARCGDCGLVRTANPRKFDYQSYHRDEDYQKFASLFKNFFLKRYKIICKFKKEPGKVLEIGASTGTFLEIFQEKGWQVWGVEPSISGEIAQKKDIKILRSTFEKAKLPQNFFDVIILNHTLEHLENPVLVLQKAKKLLKKNGVVLVDVPNFGSLSAKIRGKRWPYLTPEEHLFHFTPGTLKKVFKKAGLGVIHTETHSGVFDCGDVGLEIWQAFVGRKKRFLKDVFTLPGSFVITYILNQGTSLTMVGRRTP